jgi:hypothetical protein
LILILLPIIINAQFSYRAISNIVVANERKGAIDVGVSYEFSNKKAQIIYNLTDKYFVFGSYNKNNSSDRYKTLFGDQRITENLNSGFSLGCGMQKLGKIGNFNNTEILIGFESQTNESYDYAVNYHPEEKDYLNDRYYKVFTQFNMMKNRTQFDFGFSFKLSYLKIDKYNTDKFYETVSDLKNDFTGKSTFIVDPTVQFNYKLLPNKNLILSSQAGFSSALWTINDKKVVTYQSGGSSSSEETIFLFSPILKLGIQYRFNLYSKK